TSTSDSSSLQSLRKWYWLSLGAFIAALLSKTSVVILPLALLLSCWWLNGKITRSDLLRVAPYFALSIFFGFLTFWFQYHRGGQGVIPETDTLLVRLLAGSWGIWFYLYKAILPVNLSMIYPRWTINPGYIISYLPVALLMIAFVIFWRFQTRVARA